MEFGNFAILEISKIPYLENSKSFQFRKFQKFLKFYNFENQQTSEIFLFRKTSNFLNFTVWKTIKIS